MLGLAVLLTGLLAATAAVAQDATVAVNLIDEKGVGEAIGTVRLSDSKYGLIVAPNLAKLAPGPHGFHVHENPNCGPKEQGGKMVAGLAAGGHYDPGKVGKHDGPYQEGHLGDLPVLWVAADGTAKTPVVSPRLKLADARGRSLMIHAGGDNYADQPAALGGGGARVACGLIK
jgi:Cu-Zn family superoxide dismutase